jgi:hypothetical protein
MHHVATPGMEFIDTFGEDAFDSIRAIALDSIIIDPFVKKYKGDIIPDALDVIASVTLINQELKINQNRLFLVCLSLISEWERQLDEKFFDDELYHNLVLCIFEIKEIIDQM